MLPSNCPDQVVKKPAAQPGTTTTTTRPQIDNDDLGPAASMVGLEKDAAVRVTGTIRQFDVDDTERLFDVDLDDRLYGGFDEKLVIVANQVTKLPPQPAQTTSTKQ